MVVERSSRRIPWCKDGQLGEEDQGPLLAQRASSDIDAGEGAHKFVSGPLGELWQSGIESQELTAEGEEMFFGAVGQKAEVTHAHEAFGDHVK